MDQTIVLVIDLSYDVIYVKFCSNIIILIWPTNLVSTN